MELEAKRTIVQKEDTAGGRAVSEAIMTKLGQMCNFLNRRHIERAVFNINGNYSPAFVLALPFFQIDQLLVFEYPVEIVNIYICNRINGGVIGPSSFTELDIKWNAAGSTEWTSIFSGVGGITPKFHGNAANYSRCGIGDTVTGFDAPNPVKTTFNAKDAIRMDLLWAVGGEPNGCSLIVHYRPI